MKVYCKPCRTSTECFNCWGAPFEPTLNGGFAYVPTGFFRMGQARPGWSCCGVCKGSGKRVITSL